MKRIMRAICVLFMTLLFAVPANAVVITCVSESNSVARIDYSASDETILPIAFALDVTVDGGAIIKNVYDYKVGDSNAASPGYGIFPASMKIDENGEIFDWGSPVDNNGIGTSAVTLAMASRYSGVTNAPKVSGTLCRILVDRRGAATVNVRVAANTTGGGVVLQNATVAKFSAVGCTLSGSSLPPTIPSAPATITYPASSSTGQYTVSWASSTGATSYQLERSNNAGSTWTLVYSGANLTYSESVVNGSYRYRVRATNSTGASSWTTGTVNCVVSITTPTTTGTVRVNKCTVIAGSKLVTDSISVSGFIDVNDVNAYEFTIPGSIVVTISSADIVSPCVQTFPIDINTFKAGKYRDIINEKPLRTSFTFDTATSKFSFAARNVSLKGLSCPVHIEIKIGDYTGAADINETIVNGAHRLIPIKLMMGVKDSLRVSKIGVKRGTKPSSDQLRARGRFAVADTDVNMVNVPLVITLDSQSFTIPANSFKAGKNRFTCSKVVLSDGSVAGARFNLKTCAFRMAIKNTEITAGAGNVNLGLKFASFNKVEQVSIKEPKQSKVPKQSENENEDD